MTDLAVFEHLVCMLEVEQLLVLLPLLLQVGNELVDVLYVGGPLDFVGLILPQLVPEHLLGAFGLVCGDLMLLAGVFTWE